ncbi:MAG: NAD(P)H-hydrate dehydratase [Lachnospiraceae bacterium]|nr:NAD(P)H-hydrate dehydratase [Lachnospiraceae bacterium]
MRYLVNSREMRQYDKNTSEVFKVPSLLLMEQAALAACEEIEKITKKEETVLIVCGTGNNGGDGLAIARIMQLKGYAVDVVLAGDEKKATEQNRKQQEILASYQMPVYKDIPEGKEYQVIVDAIFGVGLTRKIEGVYRNIIEKLNTLSGYKVAIDIPSGVSADDGAVLGTAFYADKTITFAFDKIGLHLWPGNVAAGKVVVKEIGITERSFRDKKPAVAALGDEDLACLMSRPSHANKGTFGKLLVIAGNVNMAGAAILAGKSAYATGCGLVRILTPEENRVIIQTALPEAILTTYSAKKAETDMINEALDWADVVLIGPGIGTGETAEAILKQVLKSVTVPVVMDADALNLVAKEVEILKETHVEMVITPHLGEMSRLTGVNVAYLQTRLLDTAKDFANAYRVTCVLKDERTIISTPHGMTYLNLSGNSGMATAGSGDVLAGMIGSLMAQGHNSEIAAPLAVYLHGAAGDCMIQESGKAGLIASDLIVGIRRIFGCKER